MNRNFDDNYEKFMPNELTEEEKKLINDYIEKRYKEELKERRRNQNKGTKKVQVLELKKDL